MRVWLVGGGTAGHVLPLLALAVKLKQQGATPVFVIDRAKSNRSLVSKEKYTQRLHTGKFRRYHGRSWAERIFDVGTLLNNAKDIFTIVIGFFEALGLIIFKRPKVIFINGGAIGVPVAWAATITRVPYLIHESDVVAGLANKLIAGRAVLVLTGFPTKLFNIKKTAVTGIPLRAELSEAKKADPVVLKKRYGFSSTRPLVLITGGSLGARTINHAIAVVSEQLSQMADVAHITGSSHLETVVNQTHYPERGYRVMGTADATTMSNLLAIADLVVSRAGATTLAELAFMGKPAIIVPNPMLTGGHQLQNSRLLAEDKAVVQVEEAGVRNDPQILLGAIADLLKNPTLRHQLAARISRFSRPDAADAIVGYILAVGRGERVLDA